MTLVAYHGTDRDFVAFDELYLGSNPDRCANGLIGVWVSTGIDLAQRCGKRLLRVEAEPSVRQQIPVAKLHALHDQSGAYPHGQRSFYRDLRSRFLNEGIQAIDVVESDGSVGMSIIVDLTCIKQVEELSPQAAERV